MIITLDLLEGRRAPLPPMEWPDALGFVFALDGFTRGCHAAVMRAILASPIPHVTIEGSINPAPEEAE